MYISCVGILGRTGESKGSAKGLANWIDTGPNRTVRFLCINLQGSTLACIWPQCCTIPHKKFVSCIFSNKCRANKGSISHGPGNGILISPVFCSTIWLFCCFTWEPSFCSVLEVPGPEFYRTVYNRLESWVPVTKCFCQSSLL
jgi:hypothetical protein